MQKKKIRKRKNQKSNSELRFLPPSRFAWGRVGAAVLAAGGRGGEAWGLGLFLVPGGLVSGWVGGRGGRGGGICSHGFLGEV